MTDQLRRSVINRASTAVGRIAALLILPNIAIVLLEVFLRYALGRPTVWVNETTQFLFGISFLLGGAYTLAQGGHVRVDVVLNLLSARRRAWVELASYPLYWQRGVSYQSDNVNSEDVFIN